MIPSAERRSGSSQGEDRAIEAWRAEFLAPVASFRDPLFPGLTHGLPVPPPSTVRGLLAAASGEPVESGPVGLAAWSEGGGVDDETYHPIAADGTNPAVAGRVRATKGGMTIRSRPFLTGVHLTLWLPAPDGERLAAALRRPRWPLRLGRSQDSLHTLSVAPTRLRPAERAVVGHALAPPDGHDAASAFVWQLAASVSPDRLTTHWCDYLWSEVPLGEQTVRGAYVDEADEADVTENDNKRGNQAVWLLEP